MTIEQEQSKGLDSMHVVIAGGTGFLGMNLAQALVKQGANITILSRSKPAEGSWSWAKWDGSTLGDWSSVLDGCDALVNCAGRSIDCVPTPENKELVISSRVNSTSVLGEAIRKANQAPKVWVQLTAVGIYGHTYEPCDESSPAGTGFLPEVCELWEKAFVESCPEHVRSVMLRTGVVLGRTEGAFPKLRRLAKLGLGGTAGSGKQGMSWIHEQDMTRIIMHALGHETMNGVYNAVAPNPVSNREFMSALRKAVRMPIGPPAPAFGVKLAARFLLKTNPDLALEGQFASSERIMNAGFEFDFPELNAALKDVC